MGILAPFNLRSTDDEAAQRRAGDLRQLDQRRKATATKLDRGYDDLVSGRISEEFWKRKSQEWESELQATEVERMRLEVPRAYATATAEKILETARNGAIELHVRSRKSRSHLQ